MRKRWQGVAALGVGAALLGGALGARAEGDQATSGAASPWTLDALHARVAGFAQAADRDAGDVLAAPGTLDDGEELLPQAKIGLAQAIEAAQGAASGSIGEVDLEDYRGTLVFNVDVGDKDVKVDAKTGAVLSADADD